MCTSQLGIKCLEKVLAALKTVEFGLSAKKGLIEKTVKYLGCENDKLKLFLLKSVYLIPKNCKQVRQFLGLNCLAMFQHWCKRMLLLNRQQHIKLLPFRSRKVTGYRNGFMHFRNWKRDWNVKHKPFLFIFFHHSNS